MTQSSAEGLDARFLAQKRIVDAPLRAQAMRQPDLLDAVRGVLIDAEFNHSGKPLQYETAHQQIRQRLDHAMAFASEHWTRPEA